MISLRAQTTRKILDLFFLNEKERFYVNEIAKRIGEDPANVHKKLSELKEEGLLLDEYQGKERYFFLNKKYPFLNEYKKIALKGLGFEKILREEFGKIAGIDSAYIFGSYATGHFSEESDIDILVVGDFDFKELEAVLLNVQRKTGREINSMELSRAEFEKRKKKKDPLLEDIFSRENIKIL